MRGKEIAFASSVRALRAGGFVDELDEQAVTDYLEFGFVTDARSIYRGPNKVPAASIVEWSDGTLSLPPTGRLPRTARQAVGHFR